MTYSPDAPLDDPARDCLRCIAGHIIPGSPELDLPGADDPGIVGVMVQGLNRDAPALRNVLARVDQTAGGRICALQAAGQAEVLNRLRHETPGLFAVVESVVARAYYSDDRVLRAIGMEPRPPFPSGYTVDGGNWSLLDPVRARGSLLRDTAKT